jgi:endonuclease YncB( thermonuclease family)
MFSWFARIGMIGLFTCATISGAETLRVEKVVAADLYEVDRGGDRETVRLFGVDAPELDQEFGKRAAEYVRAKLLNKSVSMKERARDDKGIAVMDVTLDDVGSLGLHLVTQGYAWWDDQNAADEVALRKANADAIVAGTGLFANAAALSPRDFRHSHGKPDFTYSVSSEEPEMAEAPVEEEEKVREFSAKGDGQRPVPDQMPVDIPKNASVADYVGIASQMGVKFSGEGDNRGLTADNIASIPYASQLGFRNGDVITGVNGMPLRSEMDALNLYQKLKGTKQLNVTVVRGGRPTDIVIDTSNF